MSEKSQISVPRALINVFGIFLASRILYAILGVRFDGTTITGYMQFIDYALLKDRLLESLWYLHAQPPLLNLLAGIGIKLFGSDANVFFAVCFHVLGLALAVSVFFLTSRISSSSVAGYVATAVLVFSPAFVLYENWLMYTFPTAAMLTVAAVCLFEYARGKSIWWGVTFFTLLALVALTRSMFHLVWLLAIVALVIALVGNRVATLRAAAVPVLIVAAWYSKNLILFGTFSASTMLGLGLSNITTLTMPREELLPLVMDGEISPFAIVSRYAETDILFRSQRLEPTGIPILDDVRKSTGQFNYNNLQLVDINRFLTHDAITFIRKFPYNYVLGIAIANRLFFSPSSMNEYFSPENRAAIRPLEPIFNIVLYGAGPKNYYLVQPHFGFDGEPSLEVNTGYGLVIFWLLLVPWVWRRTKRELSAQEHMNRSIGAVLLFLGFNIAYVYGLSTFLELAENYRYKFLIEPMFIVLGTAAIVSLVRSAKSWLTAAANPRA